MTDTTAMSDSEFWEFLRSLRPQYPSSVDADVMDDAERRDPELGQLMRQRLAIFAAANRRRVQLEEAGNWDGCSSVSEMRTPAEVGECRRLLKAYHARFSVLMASPVSDRGPGLMPGGRVGPDGQHHR